MEGSLDKSLQSYRVMNTPTQYSWKQHWANETFSQDDLLMCPKDEQLQFIKRLQECEITICPNIKAKEGQATTLEMLCRTIIDKTNKDVPKISRKVLYSTANGQRPIGEQAFVMWNGFQVIDMDIKNHDMAVKLKEGLFNRLKSCNWFMGIAFSSSGEGLHVYTKITVPQVDDDNIDKKKLLYFTNFRHKYSFVYIACVNEMGTLGFTKDDILKWMDMAMFKPQQGAFIGYDAHPLINTHFFEDFIYVNFDSVDSIGSPEIDWITYPDLKDIFRRWEWFMDDNSKDTVTVEVKDSPTPEIDTHNKIHYKHAERWRLANTLVKLYGQVDGYKYLRRICSNNIKDKELQADCQTASRHEKPIDVWAVNRLNTIHGFKIKLNISQDDNDEEGAIITSMDRIDNPVLIRESKYVKEYHLTSKQYLGSIRHALIKDCGRVTLIEAGAGVGKTEMVKQLVRDDHKKVLMVMPFTSTIKSKVENDKDWYYSYGSRTPRLDVPGGLSVTVDKFSHMNLMDIKMSGFDYIFIDESHLLFQSEYRPVMSKVVEMIRTTEVPIILMSGTPSGEIVFFPDIVHLKVVKDDVREKKFNVYLVDNTKDLMFHMCRQMAADIIAGRRILFPTNAGTLYSKQIAAGVTYFLQTDHLWFEPVKLHYYKKSNLGEEFMDSVNFRKTIEDTQILLCSNYLSVGVDILDQFVFSIYFADLMMPQEVEQFANRLRSNNLYINLYVSKNDGDGNSRSLHKYKEMNFKLNDEEIMHAHSILRICNDMLERNPVEYRYNSLVASIIQNNKFIEYNEADNKYYLNEIAYKVTYFERKYREYVQQLPVLMRGMRAYGYLVSANDIHSFKPEGAEVFNDLKTMVKNAYDEQLHLNTTHITELLDLITEDRLVIYKEVLSGTFEIRKGSDWKEDPAGHKMTVKNVEVFEKVVPICISLSKRFEMDSIRDIFDYCKNGNGTYNFAAVNRIRMLSNIIYNDNNNRLDLPIKEFMLASYEFSDKGMVKKKELDEFINGFTRKYLIRASTHNILMDRSITTFDVARDIFYDIFKCLVSITHKTQNKCPYIKMERVELLWKEKTWNSTTTVNEQLFNLVDFLGILKTVEKETIVEDTSSEMAS